MDSLLPEDAANPDEWPLATASPAYELDDSLFEGWGAQAAKDERLENLKLALNLYVDAKYVTGKKLTLL